MAAARPQQRLLVLLAAGTERNADRARGLVRRSPRSPDRALDTLRGLVHRARRHQCAQRWRAAPARPDRPGDSRYPAYAARDRTAALAYRGAGPPARPGSRTDGDTGAVQC